MSIMLRSCVESTAAFLRNSHLGVAGNSLQNEAERLGAPLEIGEDTTAILFLIVVGTRIPVGHAVPEGVVEQDSNFAGGRSEAFALPTREDSRR